MKTSDYLTKIETKYSELNEYSVSGEIEISNGDKSNFHIEYKKGELIKIGYELNLLGYDKPLNQIIQYDFQKAQRFGDWSVFSEVPDDFAGLVAYTTGISKGATTHLPSLLIPETLNTGWKITNLLTPKMIESEGAVEISGRHPWCEDLDVRIILENDFIKVIEIGDRKIKI